MKHRRKILCKSCKAPIRFQMATETWVKTDPEPVAVFHPDHGVVEGNYLLHTCKKEKGASNAKKRR